MGTTQTKPSLLVGEAELESPTCPSSSRGIRGRGSLACRLPLDPWPTWPQGHAGGTPGAQTWVPQSRLGSRWLGTGGGGGDDATGGTCSEVRQQKLAPAGTWPPRRPDSAVGDTPPTPSPPHPEAAASRQPALCAVASKRFSDAPPPAAVSGAAAACASVCQALPRAPSKARSPHSATTGAHGGGNGLR